MAYSRHNKSTHARCVDPPVPFANGSFKLVWLGIYTNGPRQGQRCVAKTFRIPPSFEGHFFEDDYFRLERKVIKRTQKIINAWNKARIIPFPIRLSHPQIWTIFSSRERCLVEPFIENFQKFNSNSGHVFLPGHPWSDALQALSHFSYHKSGGNLLLCDIQGGIYGGQFILSDPAISSLTKAYGPSDLGQKGIHDFFARHRCTQACHPTWGRPIVSARATFAMRQGTTMIDNRPFRQPLPYWSVIGETTRHPALGYQPAGPMRWDFF